MRDNTWIGGARSSVEAASRWPGRSSHPTLLVPDIDVDIARHSKPILGSDLHMSPRGPSMFRH